MGGYLVKHLPLRVSDHAVLRYLERVGGFEIEALRAQIAARVGKNVLPGVSSMTIDGHQFLFQQSADALVVTTVMEAGRHKVNVPRDKT